MEQEKTKIGWITNLEAGKRIVAVLLIGLSLAGTAIVHLSLKNDRMSDRLYRERIELMRGKEAQIVECEQRAARLVIAELKRSDSIQRIKEIEKQEILLKRINSIEGVNNKLDKALAK